MSSCVSKRDIRQQQLDDLLVCSQCWSIRGSNLYLKSSGLGLNCLENYSCQADTNHNLRDLSHFIDYMDSRAYQANALVTDLELYKKFRERHTSRFFSVISRDELNLQESYFQRAGMALYGLNLDKHGPSIADVFWEDGICAVDIKNLRDNLAVSNLSRAIFELNHFIKLWALTKRFDAAGNRELVLRFADGHEIIFKSDAMLYSYAIIYSGLDRFFEAEALQSHGEYVYQSKRPELVMSDNSQENLQDMLRVKSQFDSIMGLIYGVKSSGVAILDFADVLHRVPMMYTMS